MKKFIPFTVTIAILLVACGPLIPQRNTGIFTPVEMTAVVSTAVAGTAGPLSTLGTPPTPLPDTPLPTLSLSSLSPTELKYKILGQFPDLFFCDPDLYPVARDDETILARTRFPELQTNQEEFQSILKQSGLSRTTTFSDDQKLLIYREHKRLNAIHFELSGDRYQFQIQTGQEGQQGLIITGTIDGGGVIDIQSQEASILTCPICLAAGALIATPRGAIRVEDLRVGDPVWTLDAAGERVSAVILRTSRVPVPLTHQVVHLVLSDGRELRASLNHPSADGRVLAEIKANDLLDGAHVLSVERLLYKGGATYDILPSGTTGFYWTNGILMGSTLADHP